MNRLLSFALCSLTVFAGGCTVRSPRPRTPQTYVNPNAAGVQATRAETFSPAPPHPAQMATAFIYLPGSSQRAPVAYQNVNGMAIYEGDILLGPVHQLFTRYAFPRVQQNPNVKNAVSTSNTSHLWPGGVIPYEIGLSVTPEKRSYVEWAVAHVTAESVLTVRPRTPTDADYVVFTEAGGGYGCSSYVGRASGAQDIRVAGCGKGSVVHEIGHAAGFYHEQSRTDRDAYVTIHHSEVSPGHESWFEIRKGANDIGTYDYASIMHYPRRAFSKSGNDTITPHDPSAQIGQREGLSPLDKAGLAQLYAGGGGPTSPPGTTPPPPSTGFAGNYTSNRGDVSCTESGSVTCSFPGGTMLCTVQGNQLDCGWIGGGQGRAVFTRQSNGNLGGTYGDLLSNNSRGAWDLVRTSGNTTAPPPPGIPGFPTIPGLPPIPTTIPGLPQIFPELPAPQ